MHRGLHHVVLCSPSNDFVNGLLEFRSLSLGESARLISKRSAALNEFHSLIKAEQAAEGLSADLASFVTMVSVRRLSPTSLRRWALRHSDLRARTGRTLPGV